MQSSPNKSDREKEEKKGRKKTGIPDLIPCTLEYKTKKKKKKKRGGKKNGKVEMEQFSEDNFLQI